MVSWVAGNDPSMSGYNPSVKKLTDGYYHFASSGVVDLDDVGGGITRIMYGLNPTYYSPAIYPNRILFKAPVTFTHTDLVNATGRWLTVDAFLLAANRFDGVPTPVQILANPNTAILRGDWATKGGDYAGVTHTVNITMGDIGAGWGANQKIWVLLLPVSIKGPNSVPNMTNDKFLTGTNPNTLGRGLSFWTDRSPGKPTITYPPNDSAFAPGSEFSITFEPNDPDAVDYPDAQRSNLDIAGFQLQLAPQPTLDNPNPAWSTLYDTLTGAGDSATAALAYPVTTGGEGGPFSAQIPGGDWQIRLRTADWGHPYPNLVDPIGGLLPGLSFENAPAVNVSPWSDIVKVSIPSQVPPPIPISPVANNALEENKTIRLSWQYRSTFNPPYTQRQRWVQIHKVGDPNWYTVFAGDGVNPYVDLPPTIVNPTPIAAVEYFSDGGFEGGGVDGWQSDLAFWTAQGLGDYFPPGSVAVNLTDIAKGGTHSVGVNWAAIPPEGSFYYEPGLYHDFDILAGHDTFNFTGWIAPNPSERSIPQGQEGAVASVTASLGFLDASGAVVPPFEHDNVGATIVCPDDGWGPNEWFSVNLSAQVPPTAVKVVVMAGQAVNRITTPPVVYGAHLDDVSLVGSSSTNLDSFTVEATTHYEWRVKVMDTDGVVSAYSAPAGFWVVDAPSTNDVRPVPSDTIEGATLGCGTHRVFVYRRGGLERVGEIRNISHVDWGRVRDDISTSKIIVSGWGIDCGNLLAQLQTWAYEIVIFRNNGYSVDRVWEGPITLLTYEVDKVTIQAKDVMGYVYRRIMKQDMNDSYNTSKPNNGGNTAVKRAAQIIQNAFAPDDPNVLGYLQVLSRDDDTMEYRSTPAYSRTAFEEVDDMAANAGLDYTAVGRSILLWDTSHRIGLLPEFRDSNFGSPPIVSEYGMSMANRYAISDGNGVWGEATRLNSDGQDPTYGLVEMLSSTWASDSEDQDGTYTQDALDSTVASFESSAERSISDRYPPPVVVRVPDNTSITPDTPISIQQLVPGVAIPLRSTGTLRAVFGVQKLDSVSVTEESGNETITLTMSPFNNDDALASEETDDE